MVATPYEWLPYFENFTLIPSFFASFYLMTNKRDCTDLHRKLEGFPWMFQQIHHKQMIFVHKLISLPLLHSVCLYRRSLGWSGTAGSVWIPISIPSFKIRAYPDRFRLTFSEELSDVSRSSDVADAARGSSSIIINRTFFLLAVVVVIQYLT